MSDDIDTQTLTVVFDSAIITPDAIAEAMAEAGYPIDGKPELLK